MLDFVVDHRFDPFVIWRSSLDGTKSYPGEDGPLNEILHKHVVFLARKANSDSSTVCEFHAWQNLLADWLINQLFIETNAQISQILY